MDVDDSHCFSGVNDLLGGERDTCKASTWTVIVMEGGHNNSATFQGMLYMDSSNMVTSAHVGATSDCVREKGENAFL